MSDNDTPTQAADEIQQETLTGDKLDPQPPAGEGEFIPEPPQEGMDIPLSKLLPALVASAIFGGGIRKPDGSELTPEERAGAFMEQSTLILDLIGFDAAIEEIIPGTTRDVNPMYIVGGGVAATMGIALLMRPPKKKKDTTGPDSKQEATETPTTP